MARVFISHAAADKEYADAFVNTLIKLGCGLNPDDEIFYSSGEDTSIPSGLNLNEYVRSMLATGDLVIALITPTFQTRPFCVAELGAAWSRTGQLFPLMAPGMEREALEGVLDGLVVRYSDEEPALDELKDRINSTFSRSTRVATWNMHRKAWLKQVRSLAAGLSEPTAVTPTEHARLQTELEEVQEAYEEAAEKIVELEEQIEKLAALKNSPAAKAIRLPKNERKGFDAMIDATRAALDTVPHIVVEAIWHAQAGLEMGWPARDDYEWDYAERSVRDGLLLDRDGELSPNRKFPRVRAAGEQVDELQLFLNSSSAEFRSWFEETYEAPADLTSRLVWDALLGS